NGNWPRFPKTSRCCGTWRGRPRSPGPRRRPRPGRGGIPQPRGRASGSSDPRLPDAPPAPRQGASRNPRFRREAAASCPIARCRYRPVPRPSGGATRGLARVREPVWMRRPRMTHAHGRLTPGELAEAVVLADVSLALTVVGQVVPLGGALLAAAVVPLAVVAARHRLRAVITGTIAASAVGFLVIGTAALTAMGACAALGALVGAADRREWSRRRTMFFGLATLWPGASALALVAMVAFTNLRKLTLAQIRNGWLGFFHLMRNLGLVRIARPGEHVVTWVVRDWWLSVPLTLFVLSW